MRAFIHRYRDEILDDWRDAARALPVARRMNSAALVDHIPDLLDEIADLADAIADEAAGIHRTVETAHRHALDRLAHGFDVTFVVAELSLLRGAVLQVWNREHLAASMDDLRALDLAIDRAITMSVARYTEAHERVLEGLDRVSAATFEASDVAELLQRLLQVFLATMAAADTGAIFLLEPDGRLHLRAAIGVDPDLESGFALDVGEGFAGLIAAERAPRDLRTAHLDPLVRSEAMRQRGVKALYGVPLIHAGQLIGVADMGSLTAHEFSTEDRHFFDSLAARATLGIAHHMLRQQLAQTADERERVLARLESLLGASNAGIAFLDPDLRFLRVNKALEDVNERSADEMIGKTVAEVLPGAAPALEPLLRRVLETGEPLRNLEVVDPRATDPTTARTFLLNYFPVRSPSGEVIGVGGVVLDITDVQRTREALRHHQAQMQSILEHSPAAIWIKDSSGRVVMANHHLTNALGHRYEDVVGHRSAELLPPEVSAEHEAHDRAVLREQRAIEFEETVPSPEGPRTYLSIKFPIPGTPPLIGGIATEITERKRMEEALRDAVRSRENLLAVVSHDLRNPLGTIQLGTTMMLDQLGDDHRWQRPLEMIRRATVRMEALITDLLDSAAIREGRLQLDLRPEAADALVGETVELHAPFAVEKGLHLARGGEAPNTHVLCDRGRVLQVFGNLLGNALKFCRAGDAITVSAARAGDHVQFSVADTGPGIPPDTQPKLFEPYWSGSEHAKHGVGLGLYISRGIVEGHGGRIWVDSNPGTGSTFSFTLPVATAQR
ncbi:MAG TPA: PAS domain-containing protein [Kofleriaceae bacterium]|nr:PAS domain-containing protein [Kofleriaceae bacterium]